MAKLRFPHPATGGGEVAWVGKGAGVYEGLAGRGSIAMRYPLARFRENVEGSSC